MRLRLAKDAVRDLDEAWDHTAERWSPNRADALLDEFHEKFRLLARFPEVGRRRSELAPHLRSLASSGFVILYQVSDDLLEIVRIVHGSRDIDGLVANESTPAPRD